MVPTQWFYAKITKTENKEDKKRNLLHTKPINNQTKRNGQNENQNLAPNNINKPTARTQVVIMESTRRNGMNQVRSVSWLEELKRKRISWKGESVALSSLGARVL